VVVGDVQHEAGEEEEYRHREPALRQMTGYEYELVTVSLV